MFLFKVSGSLCNLRHSRSIGYSQVPQKLSEPQEKELQSSSVNCPELQMLGQQRLISLPQLEHHCFEFVQVYDGPQCGES